MQIGEKGQTAESPNSPKPFRFPHAFRLDDLDHRCCIYVGNRMESQNAENFDWEIDSLSSQVRPRPSDCIYDGPQFGPSYIEKTSKQSLKNPITQ